MNAINYCTRRDRNQSVKFLKEAFAADPRIMLDPRFGYTIARLLKNSLGL